MEAERVLLEDEYEDDEPAIVWRAPLRIEERVSAYPAGADGFYAGHGKRLLDLLLGAGLCLLATPIILVLAFVGTLTQGWPPFYSARRLGRDGREFSMWKLRTMVRNAGEVLDAWGESQPDLLEEFETNFKLRDDPRVTRFGRFLRATSLDELPQLWNVLRGDMSLVGPRPIVREELVNYGANAEVLLSVRPGVTGSWQMSGRSAIGYPERTWFELHYCRTFSAAADLAILIRTLSAPFRFDGL